MVRQEGTEMLPPGLSAAPEDCLAVREVLAPVRGLVARAEAHRIAITAARQTFDAGRTGWEVRAPPQPDAA